MKTTLLVLVITMMAASGFENNTFAQTARGSFTVTNQQAEALGTVTITVPSGDYYLTVPGSTIDTIAIADTATSITINGQTVPRGEKALITLPDETIVAVVWGTPCNVIVFDGREIE
jgi:hypothetical protein